MVVLGPWFSADPTPMIAAIAACAVAALVLSRLTRVEPAAGQAAVATAAR